MKMIKSVCIVVVMAAAMLFAQAEGPKTINVVGLESDADNATVVAPAELGPKPETVSIDADALVKKATESIPQNTLIPTSTVLSSTES